MNLASRIESILFVAPDPVSFKQIAKVTGASKQKVKTTLEKMRKERKEDETGIHILIEGSEAQMGTNPDNSDVVKEFTDQQLNSELTKAQLEALTIIAYRSPITKPELEKIRGVNCTRILRNLLVRGLVKKEDKTDKIVPVYNLSSKSMQHLGISSTEELPEYEQLQSHENIENLLKEER